MDYLCWSSVSLISVFNYICLWSHMKNREVTRCLWLKVFGLISHSSCSSTAMLLLLLPWCTHVQLFCSGDLPPPQAHCWGHLTGLGGGWGQGWNASGDEPGATSSLCHPGMCASGTELWEKSEWHQLLPSSHVSRGTDCGCLCQEEVSSSWWVPIDQECPSTYGGSGILEYLPQQGLASCRPIGLLCSLSSFLCPCGEPWYPPGMLHLISVRSSSEISKERHLK